MRLALPTDRRTTNCFDNNGFFVIGDMRSRAIAVLFPKAHNVHGNKIVFFGENSPVAILAADSNGPFYEKVMDSFILLVPATAMPTRRFLSRVCLQHQRHTGADVYPTDTSQ